MHAPEHYVRLAEVAELANDWDTAAKHWLEARTASVGHSRRQRYAQAAHRCSQMAKVPVLRKHWIKDPVNANGYPPPHVTVFLAELEQLCVKHAVVIGHEDSHGAFIIEPITPVGLKQLVVDIHVSGKWHD